MINQDDNAPTETMPGVQPQVKHPDIYALTTTHMQNINTALLVLILLLILGNLGFLIFIAGRFVK